MARINSLVCVFALAFLALASTSYGDYGSEEPTHHGTQGQPFKISNYLPRVRLPNVAKPEVAHPEVPYVPAVPKVEKPYVPTAPKVEKPYVPEVAHPEVPYVPTAPNVTHPKVPYTPTTPKVEKPYLPTTPKVEKPYIPAVAHPEVPYVPTAPNVTHPEVPYTPTTPKVEKPYVPTVPKAEKPKAVYPEVPYVPVLPTVEKPYVPVVHKAPTHNNYGVQGHVYCQSGARRIPIEGVVTKVVCFAADLVSQLLTVTGKTDKKGYFYTSLDVSSIIYQVFQCKVYLDTCPMTTCSHPTDINNGVTGARLSLNYHSLPNNKKLYSVGPFVYTPEPKY